MVRLLILKKQKRSLLVNLMMEDGMFAYSPRAFFFYLVKQILSAVESALCFVVKVLFVGLNMFARIMSWIGKLLAFLAFLWFLIEGKNYIESLQQPYQGIILIALIYVAAFLFVCVVALAVWKPERARMLFEKYKIL